MFPWRWHQEGILHPTLFKHGRTPVGSVSLKDVGGAVGQFGITQVAASGEGTNDLSTTGDASITQQQSIVLSYREHVRLCEAAVA